LSINGGEVDHVGIYLGTDKDGEAVFIENANTTWNWNILGKETAYGLNKNGCSEG
jgi:hypothetical protein